MARKPRIEYPGATYHVMCRGNQRQDIFLDDRDRWRFLDTMEEAHERTGWRTFAYVFMSNHYHWFFQTPEPNLVAGMKWLQGTYTQRFNRRHNRVGHLFQGRYKALAVDRDPGYASVVANYIHLNPARARLFDLENGRLTDYRWSSYPACLRPSLRPSWLDAEGLLNLLDIADDPKGRSRYRQQMNRRVLEIACSATPWEVDARWEKIRRGWCFGGDSFADELLEILGGIVGKKGKRISYDGEAVREHDEREARRLLAAGLETLRLCPEDLAGMRKSAPEKQVLAWLIRRKTCVSNAWIAERLHMGLATNLARQIQWAESNKNPHSTLRRRLSK